MSLWSYYWRLFGTATSFLTFGLGGVLIEVFAFPCVHLFSATHQEACRRCQYIIHLVFRLHIRLMSGLGVLSYEISGAGKLQERKPTLVIANHPSLIDVEFVISLLPRAVCIVKRAAWFNPFMAGIVRMAGYIPGNDPAEMIAACDKRMADGDTLIIFPEGTRTVPDQPMKLKRGAASVLRQSRQKITPITISCSLPTLTKTQKWHQIPESKPHFKIVVGDPIDPAPFIVDGEINSRANRRLNKMLNHLLQREIQRHG